jgi:hypothetical protein
MMDLPATCQCARNCALEWAPHFLHRSDVCSSIVGAGPSMLTCSLLEKVDLFAEQILGMFCSWLGGVVLRFIKRSE